MEGEREAGAPGAEGSTAAWEIGTVGGKASVVVMRNRMEACEDFS
jgi:hypothetical protein